MRMKVDPYVEAVSGNLGLVSAEEQSKLRLATIVVAGLTPVTTYAIEAMTRLGVGAFHMAETRAFAVEDFSSQSGGNFRTLGQSKMSALMAQAAEVNEDIRYRYYPDGVTEGNVDDLLSGTDLVIDGLGFEDLESRRLLHRKARKAGKYALCAVPTGTAVSYLVFSPRGPSFDRYFGFKDGQSTGERFKAYSRGLLVKDGTKPALVQAALLGASLVISDTMNLLLDRQVPRAVPRVFFFDPAAARPRRLADRWVSRWFRGLPLTES